MGARLRSAAILAALALTAVPASGTESVPEAEAATSWNKPVRSYPGLRIPRIFTTVHDQGTAPGFIFLTPRAKPHQRTGPTILDAQGRVVWFHQLGGTRTAINLQPQTYQGKRVLTWGQRPPLEQEGDLYTGNARTVYNIIADEHYRVIARVRARGRGINTDLHEFAITRRNTALVLGFRTVPRNLRRFGGPRRSAMLDNVVQEIDIKTGKVLFEWSAVRRLSPRGSAIKPPETGGWDAYHINAVSEDSDGNLLVTSRHKSAVYKLDRKTGHVIWQLGGKGSDFKVSRGATFVYPHDAFRASDGTLTIFDNRSTFLDKTHGRGSRAVRIRLNTRKRTASLAGAYRHPSGDVLATSQGNSRVIENGNVFVGWGSSPWFSEHAPDGRILFAAHTQSQWNQSYRAFKGPWKGTPLSAPAVVASTRTGRLMAYASWNGATEVAAWRVWGGRDAASLAPLGVAPWADFETKLTFPGTPAAIQVEAVDASGSVIGRSPVVTPKSA